MATANFNELVKAERDTQLDSIREFKLMLRSEGEESLTRKRRITTFFCNDVRSTINDFSSSKSSPGRKEISKLKSSIKYTISSLERSVYDEMMATDKELMRGGKLLSETRAKSSDIENSLQTLHSVNRDEGSAKKLPLSDIIETHLQNASNSYGASKLILDVIVAKELERHISNLKAYQREFISNTFKVVAWSKHLTNTVVREHGAILPAFFDYPTFMTYGAMIKDYLFSGKK